MSLLDKRYLAISKLIPSGHSRKISLKKARTVLGLVEVSLRRKVYGNDASSNIILQCHKQIVRKFKRCKNTAKITKVPFNLSESYFEQIICKGCHYCGEPVMWHSGYSIDKKDPKGGYIIGNVVAACKECNMFKGRKDYRAMVCLSKSPSFKQWKSDVPNRWTNRVSVNFKVRKRLAGLYMAYGNTKNWKNISSLLFVGDLELKAIKFAVTNIRRDKADYFNLLKYEFTASMSNS